MKIAEKMANEVPKVLWSDTPYINGYIWGIVSGCADVLSTYFLVPYTGVVKPIEHAVLKIQKI